MKPGDQFVPAELYRQTGGKVYPPAILARQNGIPDNLKLLYWRLYLHFGENASAWPGIKTLAEEVGKCKRQVQYDMQALAGHGLIRIEAKAIGPKKRGNRYFTLWHPMFEQVQSTAPVGDQQVQSNDQQVQSNVENEANRCNPLPRNSSSSEFSQENTSSKSSFSSLKDKDNCEKCDREGLIYSSKPDKPGNYYVWCTCDRGELYHTRKGAEYVEQLNEKHAVQDAQWELLRTKRKPGWVDREALHAQRVSETFDRLIASHLNPGKTVMQ